MRRIVVTEDTSIYNSIKIPRGTICECVDISDMNSDLSDGGKVKVRLKKDTGNIIATVEKKYVEFYDNVISEGDRVIVNKTLWPNCYGVGAVGEVIYERDGGYYISFVQGQKNVTYSDGTYLIIDGELHPRSHNGLWWVEKDNVSLTELKSGPMLSVGDPIRIGVFLMYRNIPIKFNSLGTIYKIGKNVYHIKLKGVKTKTGDGYSITVPIGFVQSAKQKF